MDYLFEDLPELEIPIAKQQLNCLTDIFYEYTRYGLFVDFDYCPDIHKYQLPYKSLIIGDLTIESPDLEHGATAMICISNGLVSYLEIWAHAGYYPLGEPANYELIKGRPVNIISITLSK